MHLVRLAHVIGFVFLAASGFGAWLTNRAAQGERGDAASALDRLQRTFTKTSHAALVVSLLSGLGAIRVFRHDGPHIMKATWLLAMMALFIVAGGLAGAGGARAKKLVAATDEGVRSALRQKLGTIHAMYLLAVLGALACGIFRFTS
jgi:hypothetical protein